MLKFFVNRPITTLMFVLFWIVLGIVSFPKMNIEKMPSIDFPMVTSSFIYPGASPNEIESQVLKKVEDSISEVAGLKKITTQAFENGGFVVAEFSLGVNVNDKASEIKSKLDSISSNFPKELKQPIVEKLNPLQQSVIDIIIKGANPKKLQEYIDNVMANKITSIRGVASISVYGGETRAIRISLNPELMTAYGITIMDVVSVLGNKNLNIPGGKIEFTTDSTSVRFVGEFKSLDDIKKLNITTQEGEIFKLSDIATIKDSVKDIEKGARYNGDDSVIISVIKSSDGNAIKISKDIRKKIPLLKKEIKEKFENAEIILSSDSSLSILKETYSTIFGIFLGIIFTILILFIFTKNLKSTVIAGVVIPASLIAGFFFMQNSGFSINSMTLLAYSSALGTLVANAIILIESCLQEMSKGKNAKQSAIDGTKKVAVPIIAGVGTNVVVFLPLAFMGGIAGQFMSQFGMTVVYVTLLSLLFSFTLTPMMIGLFLKPSKMKNKIKDNNVFLKKIFDIQLKKPKLTILFSFLILILSIIFVGFTGNEFSPTSDTNKITINIRTPMGSTYEKSKSVVMQVEERIKGFKEIKSVIVNIGNRGLQNILIKLDLVDKSKRKYSDKELTQQILLKIADIPDAEIQIRAGEAMSGSGYDMVLHVNGLDDIKRNMYAEQVINILNKIPEIQSAVLGQQKPGIEMIFNPDVNKMNFWGVNNSYVGMTLRSALFGNDTYKFKENGSEYPIIIEFADEFKNREIFENIYVNSKKGLVGLSELGNIENQISFSSIQRIDKNRITEINVNLGKSTVGVVQRKIQKELKKINFENNYNVTFAGISEIQSETTSEISKAFILASLLTFMLLAGILNSLAHPFTIATSIITSFSGVFILLFLTGSSINVGAMLAFVMLVGLVVNNNIIVLEPTVMRIQNGENPKTALWNEFVDKKNMVLMTSIAIVMGMLPQLISSDGLKVSMAAVMIGGMIASLVWTFALTPALFIVIENIKRKIKK